MKEGQQTTPSTTETWSTLITSRFPGAVVHNNTEIQGQDPLQLLFTLCLLYADGTLQESKLLQNPEDISDSRVAGKWLAIKEFMLFLQDTLGTESEGVVAQVVFANTGVLLETIPTEVDYLALQQHEVLYQQAVCEFMNYLGIPYSFSTFTQLGISFPQFVHPEQELSFSYTTIEEYIQGINRYLQELNSPNQISNINKKKRSVVKELIHKLGERTAFWIITGYLVFDHLIVDLIGKDGMYLSTERMDSLFRIAYLTESLKEPLRVEIKA